MTLTVAIVVRRFTTAALVVAFASACTIAEAGEGLDAASMQAAIDRHSCLIDLTEVDTTGLPDFRSCVGPSNVAISQCQDEALARYYLILKYNQFVESCHVKPPATATTLPEANIYNGPRSNPIQGDINDLLKQLHDDKRQYKQQQEEIAERNRQLQIEKEKEAEEEIDAQAAAAGRAILEEQAAAAARADAARRAAIRSYRPAPAPSSCRQQWVDRCMRGEEFAHCSSNFGECCAASIEANGSIFCP
jgi:hypothetical protein